MDELTNQPFDRAKAELYRKVLDGIDPADLFEMVTDDNPERMNLVSEACAWRDAGSPQEIEK